LLVFIFEVLAILSILNIVLDYKIACFRVSFFQRYNFVFIFITLLVWFLWNSAWKSMSGLSYGFYIMIGIVVWWFLLKFYYRYYKSKLYQRRIINQLLRE
jgi:RsiW-degrading membrane proteinase PrsW (M82 family)